MSANSKIDSILQKFRVLPEDLERVRGVGPELMAGIEDHLTKFYSWMREHDEFQKFFGNNPERLVRVRKQQAEYWRKFFEAVIDENWFVSRQHVGAVHAYINLPNDIYFAGISISAKSLIDHVKSLDRPADEIQVIIESITKLVFLDAYVVIEEITRINQEKIQAGSRALLEVSTPVTPIWEGILLLPLLGIIDTERTHDIMSKMLNKIAEFRAKVFVLDISGVSTMDTAVANQLIKMTRATQLMGCETIISGVSPSIARTLVELGVSIGEVRTTAALRDSFELALKVVGVNPQLMGIAHHAGR